MKPTRILMIEDDVVFGRMASDVLSQAAQDCRWYIAVTQMITLEEGNKYADKYDAIILDLGLPDSSTEETMAWIRQNAARMPPIIVVTGSDFDTIRRRCMVECGAADFMWRGDMTINPILTFQRIIHAVWRKEFCRANFIASNAA